MRIKITKKYHFGELCYQQCWRKVIKNFKIRSFSIKPFFTTLRTSVKIYSIKFCWLRYKDEIQFTTLKQQKNHSWTNFFPQQLKPGFFLHPSPHIANFIILFLILMDFTNYFQNDNKNTPREFFSHSRWKKTTSLEKIYAKKSINSRLGFLQKNSIPKYQRFYSRRRENFRVRHIKIHRCNILAKREKAKKKIAIFHRCENTTYRSQSWFSKHDLTGIKSA